MVSNILYKGRRNRTKGLSKLCTTVKIKQCVLYSDARLENCGAVLIQRCALIGKHKQTFVTASLSIFPFCTRNYIVKTVLFLPLNVKSALQPLDNISTLFCFLEPRPQVGMGTRPRRLRLFVYNPAHVECIRDVAPRPRWLPSDEPGMSNDSLESVSEDQEAPFSSGTMEDSSDEERPLLENASKPGRCHGWRKILISVCIWIGYLLISAAYSVIGPFFPQEVRLKTLSERILLPGI